MPHAHPTILIVDDHDDAREGLSQLFRAEGYTVETARDGREALEMLRDLHPCIVLLDLNMPDMSGYEFRQAQLADPDLKRIPVIVYSGEVDIRERAQQMQAAAFAVKPMVLDQLMALIRQHCLK